MSWLYLLGTERVRGGSCEETELIIQIWYHRVLTVFKCLHFLLFRFGQEYSTGKRKEMPKSALNGVHHVLLLHKVHWVTSCSIISHTLRFFLGTESESPRQTWKAKGGKRVESCREEQISALRCH